MDPVIAGTPISTTKTNPINILPDKSVTVSVDKGTTDPKTGIFTLKSVVDVVLTKVEFEEMKGVRPVPVFAPYDANTALQDYLTRTKKI